MLFYGKIKPVFIFGNKKNKKMLHQPNIDHNTTPPNKSFQAREELVNYIHQITPLMIKSDNGNFVDAFASQKARRYVIEAIASSLQENGFLQTNNSDVSLLRLTVSTLKGIENQATRLCSGNASHLGKSIEGDAKRALEFILKHY
jgi:hypothetical protein